MSKPDFVDNRDGNNLAATLNNHFQSLRMAGLQPDELCIATGYFNAAGWFKVAEQVEDLTKVRLLIGAEPTPSEEMIPRQPGDPREPELTAQRVKKTLEAQTKSLAVERDTEFDFDPASLDRLKRLVDFFRSDKVEVRRYPKRFFHAKAWLFRGESRGVLAGSSNLTAAGLAGNLELNLGHYDQSLLDKVDTWYDEVWEEAEPFDLAELYDILFEEFSPWLIYLKVLWELYGDEVEEEQEEIGHLTLTRFQQHGIWRARRILDELGGVIIADGVGLGKTFVAGGIMETYRGRRQRILLIRPAALSGTWDKFLNDHYLDDVESISYEKLAGDRQFDGRGDHLKRPIDEYQLVVIDEAHNYRNPDAPTRAGILRQFLRGRQRDLVLLTATPVNNNLYDLYHLLSFFLKQDSRLINKGIPSIKNLFEKADSVEPGDLHPDLLYPLVDATTVKRTRQFIKKHYSDDRIPGPDGELIPITFPKPIPQTVRYDLDGVLPGLFAEFAEALMPEEGKPELTMARYQVERYLHQRDDDILLEGSLIGLLRSGLLKRFESSAHAFSNTCKKMAEQHRLLLEAMDSGHVIFKDFYKDCSSSEDLDDADFQELLEESEHTEPIEIYDAERLRTDVENDLELLENFGEVTGEVTRQSDPKLSVLVEKLAEIALDAQNDGYTDSERRNNRKVLIFSYYKDTAIWIRDWLEHIFATDERLSCYKGRLATTSGSPDESEILDSHNAAWGFAPNTAAPAAYMDGDQFDCLIATDVLAEGVNLQQCRNIINYDLPWNPMRLVQRHGRIDRLLSPHKRVFLKTFFPDKELNDLLRLEERVRSKLALAAASVGLADTPIEGAEVRDESFAETRVEIERIQSEETDIFEKGGTDSAAQTGEEYRQVLRKALSDKLKKDIEKLPWKVGSGMAKGSVTGHFFCAKIGGKTELRFVPSNTSKQEDIVTELGTCLRIIECTERTPRVFPEENFKRAFEAWKLARENMWSAWDFFTDAANLQPKIRKLNREVEEYLAGSPPPSFEQKELDTISNILLSPWPMREENKLREVWKFDHTSRDAKGSALVEAIRATGILPFEQPERFPHIEHEEVRLVCWLYIEAE